MPLNFNGINPCQKRKIKLFNHIFSTFLTDFFPQKLQKNFYRQN